MCLFLNVHPCTTNARAPSVHPESSRLHPSLLSMLVTTMSAVNLGGLHLMPQHASPCLLLVIWSSDSQA